MKDQSFLWKKFWIGLKIHGCKFEINQNDTGRNKVMDREENEVKIGKVTLDYQYYEPELHYSDGNIENILLDAAQKGKLQELLYSSNEWAVLYHCSNIRENLLDWYPFRQNASLLEIGSGCGALTGLFSRKVESVTCIELSERRSMINAYRNQECDNIRILLGNFENIQINEKFDYITLIGVWEYAEAYMNGAEPYRNMLKKLRQYLKTDGKLLIAIENKMGLKYWNGAVEDHTGKMYSGLNDYMGEHGVRTFSRMEIEEMLKQEEFETYKFYYPMPDYKLPNVIYSDDRLPASGEVRNYREDYNAPRIYNFYDAVIVDQICRDNMFSYFANSFLVECGTEVADVIYAKYSRIRRKEYAISTVIEKKGERYKVSKRPLTYAANKHIEKMSCHEWRGGGGLKTARGRLEQGNYVADYINGQDLDTILYTYRNNANQFISKVKEIMAAYLMPDQCEMTDFYMTDEYKKLFGDDMVCDAKCLKITNLDLIFSNLKLTPDKELYCIDAEWIFSFPVPYEYVMWRALTQLYDQYMIYLRGQVTKKDFMKKIGIKEEHFAIYEAMEKHFADAVLSGDYRKRYRQPVMMYDFLFR